MSFRKTTTEHRRLQLFSLIDLIFILLIFFIISSILIKLTRGESQLYLPTPKNEIGEAQILIQIMEDDRYLWIDHTAIDTLQYYSYTINRSSDVQTRFDLLQSKLQIDADLLAKKIANLLEASVRRPDKDYFVLIRCPDEKPYHYATNILEKLVGYPNVEYGCVSGTIGDLRASKTISVEGNVIQFDF